MLVRRFFYSFPLLSKLKHILKNKKTTCTAFSEAFSDTSCFVPINTFRLPCLFTLVHKEVYLKKDALQDRSKPAIGSEELIYLSTSSWDQFFNFSITLFDRSLTSAVSCTTSGLLSLILDWSGFVFKSNLKLVLYSKCEWSDIMQCIQFNPILKKRCVCSGVVSSNNTHVLLSANKLKLIWLLTVLHKNSVYILMMKIAVARQE